MNCRRFQNRLYEYVEGTLSAGAQAAAERHLAGCPACRVAVRREHEMAQALGTSLRQRVANLSLEPEVRQRILAAARRQPATLGLMESLAGFWKRFAAPAAIAMILLLVIASLMTAALFFGPSRQVVGTLSAESRNLPPAVSIQISARVPTYKFHRENNYVTDTLSDETVVASGTLQLGSPEPLPKEQKRKAPL
jgi:anti-sigma factor RsiW